jgi:hypothetical protein
MTRFGLLIVVLWSIASSVADDKTDGDKVSHEIYQRPYFEKNNSGLKGDRSHLVLKSNDDLDRYFGVGFVMNNNGKTVPKNSFETNIVIAMITRGKTTFEYKINSITRKEGVVTVTYATIAQGKEGSAQFASPILISIPKEKITKIIFQEKDQKPVEIEVK